MNSPYTPPPQTSLEKPPPLVDTDIYGNPLPQLLAEPRSCRAGVGVSWLGEAFEMYKNNFLLWTCMGLALFLIMIIASFIPIIGGFIGYIMLIFIGGMMQGCAAQARGDKLHFEHLFSGFKTHFEPLLILSLLYFAGTMVVMVIAIILVVIFALMMGFSFDMLVNSMSEAEQSVTFILVILFLMLVITALMLPLMMAIWFAPALIVLHGLDAITAMKKSVKGCLKNMLPFLLYSLILLVIFPIGVLITFGFGMLVVFPLFMISYYTSYRDVWTDQPLSKNT
ncbi:BPSS1780 family membrane protein [Psychrobacter sp. I-STPA6b]|uniref:BPSS1780 family membrane protein n=1 Tax=Psychrobacter sp. I-STPA6b TaxID=2585718 RepID=UPI001D0C9595|nr:BPSS1780 family membrane protein [Psychrobacter sp. I-STPA6b]